MADRATSRGITSRAIHRERVMWVTPSRIAYRSLFGQPGMRTLGAWVFYVALDQPFDLAIDSGPFQQHWVALVPPFEPHQVRTPDRSLAKILIEPETLGDVHAMQALIASPRQASATRRLILEGFDRPLTEAGRFDAHFLGVELPSRKLDPRVITVIKLLSGPTGGCLSAEQCAELIAVSVSYFTHLFTSETGYSFRRLRAWKRARALLPIVATGGSLVDIALETGYADSTHFSHAIRQFYGCKPRDIIAGSRRLAVHADWTASSMMA